MDSTVNDIILGEEQELALNSIKTFIKEGKDPAFLLQGSAGTGKSLLTSYIIKWCEDTGIQYQLCAPTHKAALVMSRYTNRDAITLHKLLSLSPKLDIFALDFNNLMFKIKDQASEMPYKGVVICDEASMINDDLYQVLLEKCGLYNNKLLFIADLAQLQPVKQDYLSKIAHTEPCFSLTKIWRQQEENALLPVLQILRTHSLSRFESRIGTEGSLEVTHDMKRFLSVAKSQFSKAIKNSDILETKILCYTNDRVRAYNSAMHKVLFGENEYYKGEFLIGCENLEFNGFKFYNSMDYIVISEPEKVDIYIPNFMKLPAWRIELYDSLSKRSESIAILSNKDISYDYFNSLTHKIEDYRQSAVAWSSINKAKASFYWKKYYEMINSFTTPIDLYYDGRLIRKKSFDYSYALTSHKSQGSSYNNVLVDIRNINSCKDESVTRQLQYVALSRTRKDALIYQ